MKRVGTLKISMHTYLIWQAFFYNNVTNSDSTPSGVQIGTDGKAWSQMKIALKIEGFTY